MNTSCAAFIAPHLRPLDGLATIASRVVAAPVSKLAHSPARPRRRPAERIAGALAHGRFGHGALAFPIAVAGLGGFAYFVARIRWMRLGRVQAWEDD